MDDFESDVMVAYLGILHNAVLSFVDLINIVNDLSDIYPRNKVQHFDNPLYYYDLQGLQVKFTKNEIIFCFYYYLIIGTCYSCPYHQGRNITNLSSYSVTVQKFRNNSRTSHLILGTNRPSSKTVHVQNTKPEKLSCQKNKDSLTKLIIDEINNDYILIISADKVKLPILLN